MSKRSLFNIGEDLRAFNELIADNDGEIMPDHEGALDDWFSNLMEDQEDKLASYCGVVKTLEMEAKQAAEEAKLYVRKQQAREASVARLKFRMLEYMLATGQQKAATADGRVVRWQNNGGKPGLDIRDDMVPDEWKRTPPRVPDAELIREALESGQELDFAAIKPVGKHVRIA